MTTRHFCTYFDSGYLPRGLALHQSLVRHCPDFHLWVLALDPDSEQVLRDLQLASVTVISLTELEAADPEAAAAKPTRGRVEYYFTLTPVLPTHLLERAPEIDMITYLDADLWFFDAPEIVFEELGEAPVAIIEHRFGPAMQHRAIFGRFNVGWVSFRRVPEGLECLHLWRQQCVEWCFDRLEDDRFADQKYLDRWPELFPNVHVVQHAGANVAPWNLSDAAVGLRDGKVTVNGEPLVFFHFHGLTQLRDRLVDPNLEAYGARAGRVLRQHIFRPYVAELNGIAARVGLPARSVSSRTGIPETVARTSALVQVRRVLSLLRAVAAGRRIVVARPRRDPQPVPADRKDATVR